MSEAPQRPRGPRLAALIVNYNTGPFAERCVASLREDWQRSGRAPGDLDVVLVDNASPLDQGESLARMEAGGVRVVRAEHNLGYAGGINRALAQTRGEPQDVVAILNPDLYFLPGSVARLVATASGDATVGAVDPRAYVDQSRALLLPRNPMPTLWDHALSCLALRSPFVLRHYVRRRARQALEWWTAEGLLDSPMLSGCCVFLRREVVERLGTLMDERYPLYYEDTDLFRRLHRLGLRTVHHCGAEILHHWSRSAGVGQQFDGEPRRRFQVSEQAYFRRYYGPLGAALAVWFRRRADRWGAHGGAPLHRLEDLGPHAAPPELRWSGERDFVIEFAVMPNWLLAAGVIGRGDRWRLPETVWHWFFEGAYFLRALDRHSGQLLGAWTFVKTVPGRHHPLGAGEAQAGAPGGAPMDAVGAKP